VYFVVRILKILVVNLLGLQGRLTKIPAFCKVKMEAS
jgi:hypothetical protein